MPDNITRRGVLAASGGALSAMAFRVAHAQSVPASSAIRAPEATEVRAVPIPAFDTRDVTHIQFGSLRYRSGLILTSTFRAFGGLSALRLDDRGERFVAVSDKGNWFTGRIVMRDTLMVGLADVESAPMLGTNGRPLAARGWYDTESLAFNGSVAYVGIERVNQIVTFDFGRSGVRAPGVPIALPPGVRTLPNNLGLEALVFVRKDKFKGFPLAGTLIALSERGLDADGNILAFLIGGKMPGSFAVRRTNDYDISDATLLPSGDLLILERKFSLRSGAGIRIRRIALSSIMPGATVDGPSMFDADLGYEIDNLEGIDVHVTTQGDTVITMISDDNFSMLQRTLLLQFTLAE